MYTISSNENNNGKTKASLISSAKGKYIDISTRGGICHKGPGLGCAGGLKSESRPKVVVLGTHIPGGTFGTLRPPLITSRIVYHTNVR